ECDASTARTGCKAVLVARRRFEDDGRILGLGKYDHLVPIRIEEVESRVHTQRDCVGILERDLSDFDLDSRCRVDQLLHAAHVRIENMRKRQPTSKREGQQNTYIRLEQVRI